MHDLHENLFQVGLHDFKLLHAHARCSQLAHQDLQCRVISKRQPVGAVGTAFDDFRREHRGQRIRFEARQALLTQHREVMPGYIELLRALDRLSFGDLVIEQLARIPLPLAPLQRLYHFLRRSRNVT